MNDVEKITEQACRRIRELRQSENWSLEDLAERSSVSRSMLSEIERGRANPTLAVTLKIAQAFRISLSDLVDSEPPPSKIEVVRSSDHAYQYRHDDDCQIRTLSPLQLEKDVEFYEVTITKDGELRSTAHFEGTREFLTVGKGRIRVESGEASEELRSGDSDSYQAYVPHAIVNSGRSEARIFLIVVYP